MNKNLQRICVAVDVDEYEELKKFSRSGLSTGFLIREAIHDLLVKLKKINHNLYLVQLIH